MPLPSHSPFPISPLPLDFLLYLLVVHVHLQANPVLSCTYTEYHQKHKIQYHLTCNHLNTLRSPFPPFPPSPPTPLNPPAYPHSLSRSFSAQLSMSELEGLAGCSSKNEFDGRIGIRISAIFVILAGSLFGEDIQIYSA